MLSRLGAQDEFGRDYISKYERGVLEPPLHVLLRYARLAGFSTDVLIDDELDLPAKLPAKPKPARRKSARQFLLDERDDPVSSGRKLCAVL